jgi:hypothetical protein
LKNKLKSKRNGVLRWLKWQSTCLASTRSWAQCQVLPKKKKKTHKKSGQEPMVHACNLSYSGGRDQEDHCSKPDQASISRDPISKIPNI